MSRARSSSLPSPTSACSSPPVPFPRRPPRPRSPEAPADVPREVRRDRDSGAPACRERPALAASDAPRSDTAASSPATGTDDAVSTPATDLTPAGPGIVTSDPAASTGGTPSIAAPPAGGVALLPARAPRGLASSASAASTGGVPTAPAGVTGSALAVPAPAAGDGAAVAARGPGGVASSASAASTGGAASVPAEGAGGVASSKGATGGVTSIPAPVAGGVALLPARGRRGLVSSASAGSAGGVASGLVGGVAFVSAGSAGGVPAVLAGACRGVLDLSVGEVVFWVGVAGDRLRLGVVWRGSGVSAVQGDGCSGDGRSPSDVRSANGPGCGGALVGSSAPHAAASTGRACSRGAARCAKGPSVAEVSVALGVVSDAFDAAPCPSPDFLPRDGDVAEAASSSGSAQRAGSTGRGRAPGDVRWPKGFPRADVSSSDGGVPVTSSPFPSPSKRRHPAPRARRGSWASCRPPRHPRRSPHGTPVARLPRATPHIPLWTQLCIADTFAWLMSAQDRPPLSTRH